MNIQLLDINEIKPYGRNPRRNEKAVDFVAESIEKYGFQQPIVVDKDMIIVVGHTRYKAAKKLNYQQIPVLVAAELTTEQAQAYRLADNKTNQYAKWDDDLLTEELRELMQTLNDDLKEVSAWTAFSELEIDRLLNGKDYITDQLEGSKERTGELKGRIALLVLKNSYVNRGVATYVNGWLEWGIRNNIQVDIISNASIDDISNNQFERYKGVSNWIAPQEASTVNEDNTVALRTPIIRLNDSVNLRTAIIEALSRYTYDAILLNNIDNLFTVTSMALERYHPNILYVTHSPVDIGEHMGNDHHIDQLTRAMLKGTSVNLLCQSAWMKEQIQQHSDIEAHRVSVATPMLGQPEYLQCLDEEFVDRRGILFIGPYEERKGSEAFIQACADNGLPAIVVTPSQHSADKFKKRFLELKIEHEIHVGLSGINKVTAMRQAALAIIPSKSETFCYTALEAAHICRCIIPENRAWSTIHKDWCVRVHENDISAAVKLHYNQPQTEEAKLALREVFQLADVESLTVLNYRENTDQPNNALTKLLEKAGRVSIRDYVASRPSRVIDELYYAFPLQNNPEYVIEQTQFDTYIKRRDYVAPTDFDNVDASLSNLLNLGTDNE
jgi:site-specific DNA-methyltransferase (adenine-specific)